MLKTMKPKRTVTCFQATEIVDGRSQLHCPVILPSFKTKQKRKCGQNTDKPQLLSGRHGEVGGGGITL